MQFLGCQNPLVHPGAGAVPVKQSAPGSDQTSVLACETHVNSTLECSRLFLSPNSPLGRVSAALLQRTDFKLTLSFFGIHSPRWLSLPIH
jgi:hypothetical protein